MPAARCPPSTPPPWTATPFARPGRFRLRGQVAAGQVWDQALRLGQAVGISTGAPVPAGTAAVLRLEDAVLVGGLVSGPDRLPGTDIRRTGEDAAPGTLVAPAGMAVGPAAGRRWPDARRRAVAGRTLGGAA